MRNKIIISLLILTMVISQPVLALSTGNIIDINGATATQNGSKEVIITTDNVAGRTSDVNWKGLSIGVGETLSHVFNAKNQTVIHHVKFGNLNSSIIEGVIKTAADSPNEGTVMLVNSNGIVFKDGAIVDVGSFVASVLGIASTTRDSNGYISSIKFAEKTSDFWKLFLGLDETTYGLDIKAANITTTGDFTALGTAIRSVGTTYNVGGTTNLIAAKEVTYNTSTRALSGIVGSSLASNHIWYNSSGSTFLARASSDERILLDNVNLNSGKNVNINAYYNLGTNDKITINNSRIIANAALKNQSGDIYIYAENSSPTGSSNILVSNNSEVTAYRNGAGESTHLTADNVDSTGAQLISTHNFIAPSDDVDKNTGTVVVSNPTLPQGGGQIQTGGGFIPLGASAKMGSEKKKRLVCEDMGNNEYKDCEISASAD